MERYGAGWDDEGDPPSPDRLSRLSAALNKRVAVAAVVALVAGGGFWVTHRGGGTKVGDCAIDNSVDALNPSIIKASCTDPAAVYEVAAKTTAMGACPAGDYGKLVALGGGNPMQYTADQGTSLCLALHVRTGECLTLRTDQFTPGAGSLIPRVIDCQTGHGPDRFRIVTVRTDTSDRSVCGHDALGLSYSTPREVICAARLS
jgi:hypothetical protein